MVQINFALREVNCKIVFYGPGLSGKTTNLEIVHQKAPESNKGELTSIATEGDRTLFFDFMPLDLGTIAGMRTRFQLYTVPGQVYYNSTRKLVLQGVDGIVFVADSSAAKMEENLESLDNLRNNLAEYGKDIAEIPLVIQFNKRDLPDALSVDELNRRLNPWGVPTFEAVAVTGEGVFPTLKALSGLVLETLNRDQQRGGDARPSAVTPAAPAPTTATVAPTAPPAFSGPPSTPARPGGGGAAVPGMAPAVATAATMPSVGSGRFGVPGSTPAVSGPQRTASGRFGKGASVFNEMQAAGGAPPAATPVAATGAPPSATQSSPSLPAQRPQIDSRRPVEATPLEEANIRATQPKGPTGPPRLNIRQEKSFPWIPVALGGLIVIALVVILHTMNIFRIPGL